MSDKFLAKVLAISVTGIIEAVQKFKNGEKGRSIMNMTKRGIRLL